MTFRGLALRGLALRTVLCFALSGATQSGASHCPANPRSYRTTRPQAGDLWEPDSDRRKPDSDRRKHKDLQTTILR
ncbi:MAG: hypothetical protein RBR81_06155 [Bacteroidales bacterium]|jgi:hypothetical protein|nr:hypothetical protein [Bacteroidales bacterium]